MFNQVTSLQTSLTVAPPLLFNQVLKSSALPAPSHSTIWSEAGVIKPGADVSSMVNVAMHVEKLPQSSVAVKVTVTAPVAPHPSLRLPST